MRRRWFRAKRYGWGWTPASWQGWLVLGLYALAIAGAASVMAAAEPAGLAWLAGMLLAMLATLTLVIVCYRTGDPPRWRWGDED